MIKKGLIIFFLILAVAIVSSYLFLPSELHLGRSVWIRANTQGLKRNLITNTSWLQWWPEPREAQGPDSLTFHYRANDYRITDKQFNSLDVMIGHDGRYDSSIFQVVPGIDSAQILWTAKLKASAVPGARWLNWFRAKRLAGDMQDLLESVKRSYSREQAVYAIDIIPEKVRDSILVATSTTTLEPPRTETIYALVDRLKSYAATRGANITGDPMLNIDKREDGFLTRVALPVSKRLPDSGNVQYKWMLGGGNILVTEVRGGQAAINRSFEQLQYYVEDHKRMSPAIPFLSLVTDRRALPDSNQWITKIYYPVE